jgi:hypothetical protein
MGGKHRIADPHSLAQSLNSRGVSRLAASRHADHNDPVCVDPRLGSEPAMAGEGIGIRLRLGDAVLVVAGTTHVSGGKAVDHERGHALSGKQASIIVVGMGCDAAARVDDHGGGKPLLDFRPIEYR